MAQTRSQGTKRSATEDISGSPNKSPRRKAPGKAGHPLERKASTTPKSRSNEQAKGKRGPAVEAETIEEEDMHQSIEDMDGESRAPAEDSDEDPASQNADGEGGNASENRNNDSQDDQNDQNHDEKNRQEAEKRRADQLKAVNIVVQLLLILERRRRMRTGSTTFAEQPAGLTRLCELADDTENALNPMLRADVIPFEFWWEMGDIKKAVVAASQAQVALEKAEGDLEEARKVLTAALKERSFVLMGVRERSEEAVKRHEAAVADADERISEARAARDEALKHRERCCEAVDGAIGIPFEKVEHRLIEAGFLYPRPSVQEAEEANGEEERVEGEEPAADQTVEDQTKAAQVLMQLLLILEKRRVMPSDTTTFAEQLVAMTRLCELAASPNLVSNPYLGDDILPYEFWWEMEEIKTDVAAANEAKQALEERETEVAACNKAFSHAVTERLYPLLRVREYSEEGIKAHDAAVEDALEKLHAARNKRNDARRLRDMRFRDVEASIGVPFQKAEERLVDAGHMKERKRRQQEAEQQRPEASERYRSPDEERPHSDRQANSDTSRPRHRGRPREPRRARSLVDEVQQEKRRFLEHARLHYLDAADKFDAVRHNYHRELDGFLHARREANVSGTKTDFDHSYYLAREQANHEYALAREDWDFALERAEATGALTREQRRKYLDDDGSSAGGSGRFVKDAIWGVKEEEIEAWLGREGMEATRSERYWPLMVEEPAQEGRSLAALSEIQRRAALATGRRRRMIDEWRAEQERTRRNVEVEMREKTWEERRAELPWWQVWDGI